MRVARLVKNELFPFYKATIEADIRIHLLLRRCFCAGSYCACVRWLYKLWSVVSGEATVEADIWIHLHHQRHVFVASLLKKIMLSFKFNLYKVIPWIQLGKNGVSPCPGQRWVIEYAPLRAVPDNAELQRMLRSALSRTSPRSGVCSAPHCPGQRWVIEYATLRAVQDNAEL